MGYNSWMHRKVVMLKKYSGEERAAIKRASIAERQRIKDSLEDTNPLRGVLGFLQSLRKRRNKDEKQRGSREGQQEA